jgi:histidine triad (HIT) family protein
MTTDQAGHEASCAFCEIVAGRMQSSLVYEDSDTVAFVDLRQPGWPRSCHVLVVPKPHVEFIFDLPDGLAASMMQTVVRVADAVRRASDPEGISVWSSNGAAAGQELPHVHLHVLARHDGDQLLKVYAETPARPSRVHLDELATRLRRELAGTGA